MAHSLKGNLLKLPNEAWVVTPAHVNPSLPGKETRCIWCKSTLGDIHELRCAVRQKSVIVKIEIEMERMVSEDCMPEMVEFLMNDSSWCASNIIHELQAMFDSSERCLCPYFQATYVREATEADEATYGRNVADEIEREQS